MQLKAMIEVVVPIAISLSTTNDEDRHEWKVEKYLGAPKKPAPVIYTVQPDNGITACSESAPAATPAGASAATGKSFANVLLTDSAQQKPRQEQPSRQEIGFRTVAKDLR